MTGIIGMIVDFLDYLIRENKINKISWHQGIGNQRDLNQRGFKGKQLSYKEKQRNI